MKKRSNHSKKKCGKFTPVHIDNFWRMLSEGWSYKEIEQQLGVSKWTCVDWRRFKVQVAANMRAARKYGFL